MVKYKFLEHTADIKFQAFGKTLKKVFENSAFALRESITKSKVKPLIKKDLGMQIEGRDLLGVLQDFLEEFLFLFETKGFLLSKFKKLKIKEKSGAYFIECEVLGEKIKNHKIETHVKAVTYSEMFVREENKKWIAQVVLDI